MSEPTPTPPPGSPADDAAGRCPRCDSRALPGATHCLMCGAPLPPDLFDRSAGAATPGEEAAAAVAPVGPDAAARDAGPPELLDEPETPPVMTAVMRERQSRVTFWMTAVAFTITAFLGAFVVQYAGPVNVALFPTLTPIPPTPSYTPTMTPLPTETAPPSPTPSITPTPLPTDTPQPPRFATVAPGDTLYGWSLRYNVSVESIIALNELAETGQVQSGQLLQIPWPTATPPLMPVEITINGQPAIADPRGCERYEIQEGDALFAVAARYNVPLSALLAANRRTEQDVIRPGDTVCIPQIIYDGVLPPTPGPSPTPSPTPLPAGPQLLYPVPGARFDDLAQPVVLQWAAVKDLAADEWYMVELVDVTQVESRPRRAFTRQNSFRLPTTWRAPLDELHRFRWRVSIVRVTGQRSDGQFTYTYGGGTSAERFFDWRGAVPTPTPTPTFTPAPEG